MKTIKIITFIIVFTCCGFFSCKKEINVGIPTTQITTASVFSDNATATAATLSIYAQMLARLDVTNSIHQNSALSSDELTYYQNNLIPFYRNGLLASTNQASSIWNNFFSYIYQENTIIENLKISGAVTDAVKNQLTGEALFMRAFCYFYLVNLYGDVPLALTTDYKLNGTMARVKVSQIYDQMVSDLTQAQSLLNSNYVDASSLAVTTEHIRPNSWAATALLARVYLYMGSQHYSDAEKQATNVISNTTYNLPTDLTKVFVKNSSESIWQLANKSTITYTDDGQLFYLKANATVNQSLSQSLLNDFESGDKRRSTWVSSYSNGVNTYYYPYKYRDNVVASSNNEYLMILRLTEQYLIRAEARAQQGKLTGPGSASEDLNVIRNRAGLNNYSGATDLSSLLAAIAHERRVELFTEGDRWFNLKRTNTIDAVMGGTTGACANKGGVWDTRQQLYPIPLQEIQNNSNITQNPGY